MSLYLKNQNSHERDSNLQFIEDSHTYLLHGKKVNTSVTTFVKKSFNEFNADLIINKMMNGRNWKTSKYFGKSVDEIKQLWDVNRITASTFGTKLHKTIELFYNKEDINDIDGIEKEFNMFKTFYNDHSHLTPYRTEWEVYNEDIDIAGSIDMLYENNDGTLDIYDWKRSKEISKINKWDSGKYPLQHLPDSNFWHYSLQLNMYKYILENKYDKIVNKMCLVCLHPTFDNYILYEVDDLQEEITDLLEFRKN